MSSKKVPFHRHKENEEARKKVRVFKSLSGDTSTYSFLHAHSIHI